MKRRYNIPVWKGCQLYEGNKQKQVTLELSRRRVRPEFKDNDSSDLRRRDRDVVLLPCFRYSNSHSAAMFPPNFWRPIYSILFLASFVRQLNRNDIISKSLIRNILFGFGSWR